MEPENLPDFSESYQKVFERCSPFFLPAPWDFLAVDSDCRGPISDPEKTLAVLQQEFAHDQLVDAGVIQYLPDGVQFNPALVNHESAVVALRDEPGGKPFELLTASGALSGRGLPVLASMRDARTKEIMTTNNALYVTSDIREAALLRSLGLAATVASGLHGMSLEMLRSLNQRFGPTGQSKAYQDMTTAIELELAENADSDEAEPLEGANSAAAPVSTTPSAGERSSPEAAPPPREPSLVLIGWGPLSLKLELPSWLPALTAELHLAKRHLRLRFQNINAWRPSPEDLDQLCYLLRLRDESVVREWFLERYGIHFSRLTDRPDPDGPDGQPSIVRAWNDLQERLDDDRPERRLSDATREALSNYEKLADEQLVQPLQRWALAHADPAVQNAGVELAYVGGLLHRLKPALQAELTLALDAGFREGQQPGPKTLFDQYLQLAGLFSRLLLTLARGSAASSTRLRIFPSSPLARSRNGAWRKVS